MSVDTSYANYAAAILGYLLPILFVLAVNIVFGSIAMKMARKRNLRTVPAFFAGFFGSAITLFIIAMFPVNPQA